ncbi:MAG: LON peptidase substrate-binding domain-containing protein [Hyphomonadaceae bacterium]
MPTARRTSELPRTIPVFPLGGAILFPRGTLPLNIFEPRYLNMVDDALAGTRVIGMIQPAHGDPMHPPLMEIGTLGRVTAFAETDDGRYLITLSGLARFRVEQEIEAGTPYRQVIATYEDYADDLRAAEGGLGVDRERLSAALAQYGAARGFKIDWSAVDEAAPEALVHAVATLCPFDIAAKQALLEAPTLTERAAALIAILETDSGRDGASPLQ